MHTHVIAILPLRYLEGREAYLENAACSDSTHIPCKASCLKLFVLRMKSVHMQKERREFCRYIPCHNNLLSNHDQTRVLLGKIEPLSYSATWVGSTNWRTQHREMFGHVCHPAHISHCLAFNTRQMEIGHLSYPGQNLAT